MAPAAAMPSCGRLLKTSVKMDSMKEVETLENVWECSNNIKNEFNVLPIVVE
jgi:hypothetical protein